MRYLGLILLSSTALYGLELEENRLFIEQNKSLEITGFEEAAHLSSITSDQFAFPEPVINLKLNKDPLIASALSTLCPGLGHTYLDDFKTAGGIFGSTFVTVGAGIAPGSTETFQYNNLMTAKNTWFYGIFAAYRDAKVMNGLSTYSYKMPTDSFEDLAYAPFILRTV